MTNALEGDAPAVAARDAGVAAADVGRGESAAATFAVTINRPVAEVYAYWRDFRNLVPIMENVERIDVIDDRRSHWAVSAPGGRTVEWDALVTEDRPDSLIAWESAEGADVRNSGRVEFLDGGTRGTIVKAAIAYDPPGGTIGKLVAKLFQKEPAIQVRRDLRRFKQMMETGEVSTSARTRDQVGQTA